MERTIDTDNRLAEQATQIIERLQPHAKTIVVALGGVALALLAWMLISNQMEEGKARSWESFLSALSSDGQPALVESLDDLIRRHPDTTAARWAELILADLAVSEGTDLLFTDRQRGLQRLQSAVTAYSAVLASRPRGMLASRATFGLAKARESLGQIDEARRGYEAVAEQSAAGLSRLAKDRAEALGRGATKEWYDWFAAQSFTPPQPAAPGAGADSGADQPASPASAPGAAPPAAAGSQDPAAPSGDAGG